LQGHLDRSAFAVILDGNVDNISHLVGIERLVEIVRVVDLGGLEPDDHVIDLDAGLRRLRTDDAGLIGRATRQFPTAAAAVFLFDANGRPAFDGLFFPHADLGRSD